jgi:8-oxo-dGTP diphosphatase
MDGSGKSFVSVAAGVLVDYAGRVLVARRPEGSDQAGWWEFPGGKLRPGEVPLEGLVRELGEELGIGVQSASALMTYDHEYPDRVVRLHIWRVEKYSGRPAGMEGQSLRWTAVSNLMDGGLLPADRPIVDALQPLVDQPKIDQQIVSSKSTL